MNSVLRTNKGFTPLEKAPDFSPGCKSVAEYAGIKPPLPRAQASFVRELRSLTGFTLVELVVAIGLLAIVLSFAGVIFKVSIESYRTADANTEIMQKLRAITDQLNADFKGLQKDAPLLIWFKLDTNNNRNDQILFFANGDFQSTLVYPEEPNAVPAATGKPVIGNVARIYYGQSNFNILARRQHILTANPWLFPFPDVANFASSFSPGNNDRFEHDRMSLAEWRSISQDPNNNKQIIETCFNNRPRINLGQIKTLHMLMSQDVDSFSVQWGYWFADEHRWWPRIEDFGTMGGDSFGVYFKMPGGENYTRWFGPEDAKKQDLSTFAGFYPTALKFTFTLYDSKRILKRGQTFTHIVYLAD